jgi:O-antigen/teichoic acid export membrane protein
VYSAQDLAFFNKGKYFPTILVTNLNSAIDSVLLPAMSDVQDDKQRIRAMTRRAIRISSYFMWPMMVGIAVCAEPLVTLLLTEKWLPSVPFLWIYCFTFAFRPIHTANLNAIKAMGESAVYLKIEILKKVITLPILFATMPFGVMVMASSMIVTTIISGFINAFPNKRLLNYSFIDQLIDALPPMLLSAVMGAVVYCVQFLGLGNFLTLVIQVPLGVVIYLVGSVLFKLDSFMYVVSVLKKFLPKKK